jgi:hypothetical protein
MSAAPSLVPPHDAGLERATLGALLLDPYEARPVREWLEPRDFFLGRTAAVFETIRAVGAVPHRVADLLSVSAALPERIDDPAEVLELRRLAGLCPSRRPRSRGACGPTRGSSGRLPSSGRPAPARHRSTFRP